jgi:predicted lipoprotein with Yx(FWY)xxD motif
VKHTTFFFLVLAMAAMVLIAGCSQNTAQPAPPQTTLQVPTQPTPVPTPQPTSITSSGTIGTEGSPYGTILADYQGRTLYTFAGDVPGSGTSTCTGDCAVLWPAISADTTKVTAPLEVKDFGSITRADGSPQTTYLGWPLYYYQADSNRGDINGENFHNVWFVVRPGQLIHVAHTAALGLFLTDGSGKTLYYHTSDTAGTSDCNSTCMALWPAFSADPVSAPSFLATANFTAVTRTDGIPQTAYGGRPLYTFAGDAGPGDVNGQAMGGVWFVANVSGLVPQ